MRARESWIESSARHPCPICGHGGWCRVSPDGAIVGCRFESGGGKARRDRSGTPYFLHRLGPSTVPRTLDRPMPPRSEPAPVEVRARIYRAFVGTLDLSPEHRAGLRTRGLTDAEVTRRGYRSHPFARRSQVVRGLVARFDPADVACTPGFYQVDKGDGRTWWTCAGSPGLLIPVRDLDGRIIALRLRPDDRGDGGKYRWFSSASHGGPGPGAPCHVPLPPAGGFDPDCIRLTEGELKADAATALDPERILTVSVPGVATWRAALPILSALAPRVVRLAFDADAVANPAVARALRDAAAGIRVAGFECEVETWNAN